MMKRFFFTIALLSLVLAGCSPNYQSKIQEGQNLIDEGTSKNDVTKLDDAITLYDNLQKQNPSDSSLPQWVDFAKKSKYQFLVKEAQNYYNNQNFKKAVDDYKVAVTLVPKPDDDTAKTYKLAKSQLALQDNFDKYISWLNPIFQRNSELANKWDDLRKQYTVGTITQAQFLASSKELLPLINSLITDVQNESYNLSGDLGDTHAQFISTENSIQGSLMDTLVFLGDPNSNMSALSSVSTNLDSIKSADAIYIQALKKYADDKGLNNDINLK